jgi:GT2 family glycosyltransferase
MRASVIVAAHNEGERLWKTVEAIFDSSSRLDFELLVADDASTDGSVNEAQQRFPRIIVVSHRRREGVAATRVLAAGRARGEVLIFLDGHTRPEPGALERLVQDVESTRGNAVITPQIVGLDEGTWQALRQQTGNGYALDLETFDSWWLSLKKMKEVKEGGRTFYESPALIGCALAVDRKLYDRVWGFDAHMRSWGNEDVDISLKVWTLGGKILHDPAAVVAHRFQRFFEGYEVTAEYPLANQIRSARKHFTQSVWEDWLERAQQRSTKKLWGHPEGVWARAWEVFQQDRKSAEHERAYLLGRRERDEFWYANRFERAWPATGGLASLKPTVLPSRIRYAVVEASPAPLIDSIEPDSGDQGDDVSVIISGSNLSGSAISPMDGITISDPIVGDTTISVFFDISPTAATGDRTVTVKNNNGSSSGTFTVDIGTPELDSIDPAEAQQGANIPVTLSGSDFASPMTINAGTGISAHAGTTTETSIAATFSVSSSAPIGTNSVTVSNPSGGTSNAVGFTIAKGTPPSIDSITPDEGAPGTTVPITIVGNNLTNVGINVPSYIEVTKLKNSSSTQTTASLVILSSASPGQVEISVTNSAQYQTSNSLPFTIT